MRIIVLSDTHGNESSIHRAIQQQPTARAAFFLGDGLREALNAANHYPELEWYFVRGNNDWMRMHEAGIAEKGLALMAGTSIFYTHGHLQGVKMGLSRLEYAAREQNADIALFGHTHVPMYDYADGLHIYNPGSLKFARTYGFVDITGAGIVARTVRLEG